MFKVLQRRLCFELLPTARLNARPTENACKPTEDILEVPVVVLDDLVVVEGVDGQFDNG